MGLDLGDRISHGCRLDEHGEAGARGELRTPEEALRQQFGGQARQRVALEVGAHSRRGARLLECLGHEAVVANAHKLGPVFGAHDKNDRADAEKLARADARLLFPVEHRSEAAQTALAALKARDVLVRARVQMANLVRGVAKAAGVRLEASGPAALPRAARTALPAPLRASLAPVREAIDALGEQVAAADRHAEHACATEHPETARLRQADGVGAPAALCFVPAVDRQERFSSARSVGCWLGPAPKRAQSGARDPQPGITKAGDALPRRLPGQSAQRILGPFGKDSALRRWGLRLAGRGGAGGKPRAVAAVARKRAVLLLRLWRSGADCEPLRGAPASAPAGGGRARGLRRTRRCAAASRGRRRACAGSPGPPDGP